VLNIIYIFLCLSSFKTRMLIGISIYFFIAEFISLCYLILNFKSMICGMCLFYK